MPEDPARRLRINKNLVRIANELTTSRLTVLHLSADRTCVSQEAISPERKRWEGPAGGARYASRTAPAPTRQAPRPDSGCFARAGNFKGRLGRQNSASWHPGEDFTLGGVSRGIKARHSNRQLLRLGLSVHFEEVTRCSPPRFGVGCAAGRIIVCRVRIAQHLRRGCFRSFR